MLSLEQEIKNYFQHCPAALLDNSASRTKLDFNVAGFAFDAKEKRQSYNPKNWPATIPEQYLMILDDLGMRKVLMNGPDSGIIIRDNFYGRYYFFTLLDLFSMPKARCNRKINAQTTALKGKWLIDLRNGKVFDDINSCLAAIANYLVNGQEKFFQLECYGDYAQEDLAQGGVVRYFNSRDRDFLQTR